MKMLRGVMALVSICTLSCMAGCSGGSGPSTANADTTMAASNILLDRSKTRLSAITMQGAIEELAPTIDLSASLVGTWKVSFYSNYPRSGNITFSASGAYQYVDSITATNNETGTWSVPKDCIFNLNPNTPSGTAGLPIPYYVQKSSSTRIDAIGFDIIVLEK